MRKQLFKSLLALVLVLVCGNVWGETYKLEKVNSVSAGNLYVFEQDGHVMNNVITNYALQTTTEYESEGLDGTETYVWKLVSAGNNLYYLLSVSRDLYLNNGSSTNLSFGGNSSKWSFTFTNELVLVSNTSNSNRFLGYTTNIPYVYKAYATSNLSSYPHAITMYQLVADDDNPPDVPVNPTIITKDMSCGVGENFDVSQMFSSTSDGAITYSVEGADVEYELDGTIFSSDVPGDYTIKASQAADDGEYNTGEATATLTVLAKFIVNYYSLGVKIATEEVYDGQSITNAPEVTNAPAGWSFIDWTTNDAYVQNTTAPSFFDGVVTKSINLYAVFGKREGLIGLSKMKADDSLSDGDNIVIVASNVKYDDITKNADVALYQETIKNSYVNKYIFVEDAEVVAADEKNWLTVNMKASGFSLGDKKNGYLYSLDNNLYCGETEQIWTISTTEDGQFHLQSDNRYLSYRNDLSTNNYWRMGGVSLGTYGQTVLDIYILVADTYTYATTIERSQDVAISSVGVATAYMGFDATVSGADAYYVAVSDGVANLTKVEGVIPANTGVVLESHYGGAATATFTESVATADDKVAADGNMLIGSTVDKTFEKEGYTYYILSRGVGEKAGAVGFYWDKNSNDGAKANCGANKAILAVPKTDDVAASSISIRFDGATMVENIVEAVSNVCYDLQGREVENPSNGLYIVNGNKMLVK